MKIKGKWIVKVEPEIIVECPIPDSCTITEPCGKCHKIHDLSVPCELVR